jgi:hypothetical protein
VTKQGIKFRATQAAASAKASVKEERRIHKVSVCALIHRDSLLFAFELLPYIEISLEIYLVVKPLHRSLIAEHDGEIRKAAINTLATAYKNLCMPTIIFVPFFICT